MMTTRTDLLNFLIQRYNLKSYLEIGVQNPANNFDRIICPYKASVDPDENAKATFKMTSDEYFGRCGPFEITRKDSKEQEFTPSRDLIFIDGLHHADQVRRDFFNAEKFISPNGFIVLHDCNPPEESFTHVPRDSKVWYGDVYKFAAQFSGDRCFNTVDIDCGCGVFKYKNHPANREEITWEYFDKNRKQLLNLVSADEFTAMHSMKEME